METEAIVRTILDYKTDLKPIWCPGCGDYAVLTTLYQVMTTLNLDPKDVVIVSGIGCSSRLPGFVKAYSFHGVHGRTLPTAMGVKIANPALTVLAVGGDGDGFSIGGGHVPHAARRNIDITYIVMDNEIYGLTKGQISPTSPQGHVTKSAPRGALESPLNSIAMAITYGATYVARGFSAQSQPLAELIRGAIEHKGFSFVDVISPCVTFFDTYRYFKEHTAALPADHDPHDKISALSLALAPPEQGILLGLFYEEDKPTFDEGLAAMKGSGDFGIEKLFDKFQ
jgi:2-oxoglutarate ferredoxin oxidoreductase subunit beta